MVKRKEKANGSGGGATPGDCKDGHDEDTVWAEPSDVCGREEEGVQQRRFMPLAGQNMTPNETP